MIIIGGKHQGFKTDRILRCGDAVILQGERYSVRRFKTGNTKEHLLYAAPYGWDNSRCFKHLLSLVKR